MVRDRQFIMETVQKFVGDDTSDETLQLIEDITDTLNDYDTKIATDWKAKFEENDKTWRDKYKARFFNVEAEQEALDNETDTSAVDPPKKLEFSDLFKVAD